MTSYAKGDPVVAVREIPLGSGGSIAKGTPGVVQQNASELSITVAVQFEGDDPAFAFRRVPKTTIRRR